VCYKNLFANPHLWKLKIKNTEPNVISVVTFLFKALSDEDDLYVEILYKSFQVRKKRQT
jgi:hypothetical protein